MARSNFYLCVLTTGILLSTVACGQGTDALESAPGSTGSSGVETCEGPGRAAAAGQSSTPVTLLDARTSTWRAIRSWDQGGRGGLSTPSEATEYPGPPDGRVAFCWFKGTFSGFPVPPGAKDTFTYVAYVVDVDATAVPIVASNESTAPSKAPERATG